MQAICFLSESGAIRNTNNTFVFEKEKKEITGYNIWKLE